MLAMIPMISMMVKRLEKPKPRREMKPETSNNRLKLKKDQKIHPK